MAAIPIDFKKVDGLLESGCNGIQVAASLGIHPDTLYNRVREKYNTDFSAYAASKRAAGDSLLHVKQFKKAMDGDTKMLIHLGKFRLDQYEKEDPTDYNITIVHENATSDNTP
jgi:hypothetical protein